MAKKITPKKAVKPAPKKAVKPAPKPAAKPAPKKAVKPAAKPAPKKVVKPAAKPAPKKAAKPAPKKVVKVIEKKIDKKATKISSTKTTTKPVATKIVKPVAKKIAKEIEKKPLKVAKAVVKPAKVEKAPKEPKAPKPPKPAKLTKEEKKLRAIAVAREAKASKLPAFIPELKLPELKRTGVQPIKRSTIDSTRTRYSDEELIEFKDLITDKLEKSRTELKYIQSQITKEGENGTADTENRFGGMEDGAGTLEREYLNQMATRQGAFIENLEKALMRIESKTYGICRLTGKLISKERLRAVPHATLSLEAKELQKK
jgi:RNA polymerase-binding transcription factor DksA